MSAELGRQFYVSPQQVLALQQSFGAMLEEWWEALHATKNSGCPVSREELEETLRVLYSGPLLRLAVTLLIYLYYNFVTAAPEFPRSTDALARVSSVGANLLPSVSGLLGGDMPFDLGSPLVQTRSMAFSGEFSALAEMEAAVQAESASPVDGTPAGAVEQDARRLGILDAWSALCHRLRRTRQGTLFTLPVVLVS